jgi:hypothetical protein
LIKIKPFIIENKKFQKLIKVFNIDIINPL